MNDNKIIKYLWGKRKEKNVIYCFIKTCDGRDIAKVKIKKSFLLVHAINTKVLIKSGSFKSLNLKMQNETEIFKYRVRQITLSLKML